MLCAEKDPLKKYGFICFVILQFHFLTRIDDTSAMMIDKIQAHDTYKAFVLRSRLCWSENVLEERSAPTQIMFGLGNYQFCPLLTLAIFLSCFVKFIPMRMIN